MTTCNAQLSSPRSSKSKQGAASYGSTPTWTRSLDNAPPCGPPAQNLGEPMATNLLTTTTTPRCHINHGCARTQAIRNRRRENSLMGTGAFDLRASKPAVAAPSAAVRRFIMDDARTPPPVRSSRQDSAGWELLPLAPEKDQCVRVQQLQDPSTAPLGIWNIRAKPQQYTEKNVSPTIWRAASISVEEAAGGQPILRSPTVG
ncbi:hypothetical protein DL767_010178 [Monosporascus sp. MG133]|nr:hypothetical protein DL767_010178 [Monosporascus sp. MG133]